MKHVNGKRLVCACLLALLVLLMSMPLASAAAYSKVYGQALDKLRVRESASTNATVIDNIVKNGCVYVTSSKTSGSATFIQVKYRGSDGNIQTGWVCQSDNGKTYVEILSATQAQSKFAVSGGNLPSKAVGTFTAAQRTANAKDTEYTYLSSGASGSTVKNIQSKLKALGYYSGEITGNIGEKTEKAIKKFQEKNGLSPDGIAGPQTIAKIDAVFAASGASMPSASSTTASSSSASKTTVTGSGLRVGSTGSQVKTLQQNLTTLGYYWSEITGNFGSKTESAVKRFQEEKGLTADGIAGTKTLAAIAAAVSKKGGSSSSSTSGSSSSSSGSTLKLNSTGTAVSTLQQNLKALGYYSAEITGNFGTKTEAAVKSFQSKNGLTADGVAGSKTLSAITAKLKSGSSSSGSSSSSSSSVVKLGATGNVVSELQQNLAALGYYYGDITGHFGSMTETAVKKFQKAKGLPQDGIAGSSTIAAIEKALKSGNISSASGSSSSSSSSGSSTSSALKLGSSGNAVNELQTMLKALNYYYGDITGHFGNLTEKAVRAFQEAQGLTVDGIAGVSTMNKLRTMTGSSSGSSSSSSSGSSNVAVSYGDGYYKVAKNNVHLRASYSTSAASKASLESGTPVLASKNVLSGGYTWFYVSARQNGYTYKGYVRSDMLTKIDATEYNYLLGGSGGGGVEDDDIICMIRVKSGSVTLREEASTSSEKLGTAQAGDMFYVIDSVEGWYKTREGFWISAAYVTVLSEEEASSVGGSSSGSSSGTSYRNGDTGSTVGWIQTSLKSLGYYTGDITNHYGDRTEEAVRQFQKDNGLGADGICGSKTIAAIEKALGGSSSGSGSSSGTITPPVGNSVYQVDWFSAKSSGKFGALGFEAGKHHTLTDLTTNKSLTIRVQSAGNHLDVEPLTASDTKALCTIYGVSNANNISYIRRPMMLTTSSGYQIVCSIYGVPHGQQVITDNNYNGQFCLHFTNSRTSGSDKVDADHQNAIARAIAKIQSSWGVNVQTIK